MHWHFEAILVGTGLIILLVYHIYLIRKVKITPLETSIGITDRLRRDWVEVVMSEGRDILAVQTLRNWVMASSFLASTAVIVDLALINAVFGSGSSFNISNDLNFFGVQSHSLWQIKFMLMILDFLFAFFNFALSIRYYNHASYAINIPSKQDPMVTYETVAAIINHGSTHYMLGMRAYYFSVPLVLWLFGPSWMLAGSISILIVLYNLDRTA